MKKLLCLLALLLLTVSLPAQAPLSNKDIADRLNTGGEYLSKAGTSFGISLGISAIGYGATALTAKYGESKTTPIILASLTTAITVTCSISGIVQLVKSGRALRGWSFGNQSATPSY